MSLLLGLFRERDIVQLVLEWLPAKDAMNLGISCKSILPLAIKVAWREVPDHRIILDLLPDCLVPPGLQRRDYTRIKLYNWAIESLVLEETTIPPTISFPWSDGSSLTLTRNTLPTLLDAFASYPDGGSVFPRLQALTLILMQPDTMITITHLLSVGRFESVRDLKIYFVGASATADNCMHIRMVIRTLGAMDKTLQSLFLQLPLIGTVPHIYGPAGVGLSDALSPLTCLTKIELCMECYYMHAILAVLAKLPALRELDIKGKHELDWVTPPVLLDDASFRSLSSLSFVQRGLTDDNVWIPSILARACTTCFAMFKSEFGSIASMHRATDILSTRWWNTIRSVGISWPTPSGNTHHASDSIMNLLISFRNCHLLEDISLLLNQTDPNFMTDSHFQRVASWWPRLRVLKIAEQEEFNCSAKRPDGADWAPPATPAAFVALAKGCPDLRELYISIDLRTAASAHPKGISQWEPFIFPRLRHIVFGYALFDNLKKTKKFLARTCPAFGVTNLIRWRRAKFMLTGRDDEARREYPY